MLFPYGWRGIVLFLEKNEACLNLIPPTNTLIIGDCLKVLNDSSIIPKQSVNLVVTSPPYGLGKDYGGMYIDRFDIDKWRKLIRSVGKQIFDVLTNDGSFFLNVSPIPDPKTSEIIPLDTYAFLDIKKQGFHLRNKIIWHFNNMQNPVKRLAGRWETFLWFVKDINNYDFNLDEVRIPYLTKNDKRIHGDGRNPTDVWPFNASDFWYFNRVNNMTKAKLNIEFPAVFPEMLIERIIKMSSKVGDTVLDPFLGSGTSMKVASELGRKCIGIEINQRYSELIMRRLGLENNNLDEKHRLQTVYYKKNKKK